MTEQRRGAMAVEIAVTALIVAAIAIPVLTLMFQERDTEQRARFEYAAMLAARDEMCESQFALLAGARVESLAHDWRPLIGSPLARLQEAAPGLALPVAYSPEQSRIATHLAVDSGESRLRLATLQARWADRDTSARASRPAALELTLGLLAPAGRRP